MINTDLRQNTVSLRIAIFHIPTATKQNYCCLSLQLKDVVFFPNGSLGRRTDPMLPPATTALYHHLAMHRQQLRHHLIIWQCTASNYCIISSFGNAPPATTALSHHLAMHCQQLLHYNISWQCTAFPHYWSSEIIAVNKQKKLPLIFTKTFFAQVLNLLFNQ